MSIEVPGFKPGVLKAGADLSAKQFFAVKLNGSGDVVLGGDGDLCLGALQNKPISGEACEIEMDGISKVKAGAAFSISDKLASDGSGKFITAVSAKHVVALALEAAGGADELVAAKIVGAAGQLLA